LRLNAGARFLDAGDYAAPEHAIAPEEHPMVVKVRERLARSAGDPRDWRRAVKKIAKSIRSNSLIILSGLQGSGKSTFARALVEANPDLTIYDEFTKSLAGAIHQGGYPAIFDRTHLSRKNIDDVITKMKTLVGTPKVFTVFVSASPEVCARNIWARVEQKVPMVALRCGMKKLKENRSELREDLVVTPPVDPNGILGPCWKDLL
jgi:predicted kinase